MSLNKTELVAKVAAETGQSQAAVNSVIDGLFSAVAETLANGGKVSIPGWVTFDTIETAARTGRNPQTGETINIPAGKRAKATIGSKLKAAVKK
ncbi:HU family DNA-binding protein [Canibacter zhoujuaniae]|uniref:HU family DNA-binding protein n=1 Tax=Canibacter zhoujuaniae TaxID=2708343 RepID=UPI0014227F47|nr:HU family DNA-binding protein [Canibacter zhoujuaniae]